MDRPFFLSLPGAGQDDESLSGGENGAGYCGRYTGHICRGQLSNPMSVWYNISSDDQSGGWLNEQLVTGLWNEVVRTLRQPCQSAAKVNLGPVLSSKEKESNSVIKKRNVVGSAHTETALLVRLPGMPFG